MPRRNPTQTGAIARGLARVLAAMARRPGWILAATAIATVLCFAYASRTLVMDSDTGKLVRQDAPFRLDYKTFTAAFPQYDETSVVVLTADSVDRARDAAVRLAAALRERPELFRTVYAPGADPFFEDHAFLYLGLDELEHAIDRLAEAQPALAALADDPSLRGLFGELRTTLERLEPDDVPAGFLRMTERAAEVAEGMLAGRPEALAWGDEILGRSGEATQLVVVQGREDYDRPIASAAYIEGIRALARELQLTPEHGVTVRLTGFVPLAHEELESAQASVGLAGTVSLLLLVVILGVGVRSLPILFALVATVMVSLVWTAAAAMATVGYFNTISAAFAVLLIGLGVDFGLHIALRVQECVRAGLAPEAAFAEAGRSVGGAVSLCALTSAIGFVAFIPTEYQGLADLGVIAAEGMFLALLASFTVLPALLRLVGTRGGPVPAPGEGLRALVERRARPVALGALLLGLASVPVAARIVFDFSTLGLKDPRSESMTTLAELHAKDIVTDYSVTVLAESLEATRRLAAALEALPLVEEVRLPTDFVPEQQAAKLEAIEEAALFMQPVLADHPPRPAPSNAERLAAVDSLRRALADLGPVAERPPALAATARLESVLNRLLAQPEPARLAAVLETLLVDELADRLDWLRRALRVGPIAFEDLPEGLRERWVAADGRARVVALPREDVRDVAALRAFVDAVAGVAPGATGRPVVEAGIGGIVVRSFQTALGIAAVVIAALLGVTLRSLALSAIVLAPITLASLWTVAFGVLTDTPFNMANVIVIPLVVGLGVDNGIHVVLRHRDAGSLAEVLRSSTPRAVLLSALTTLAAFGSLGLSSHRGIQSLGVLLAVAVASLIVATLVVLPALLHLYERHEGHEGHAAGAPHPGRSDGGP